MKERQLLCYMTIEDSPCSLHQNSCCSCSHLPKYGSCYRRTSNLAGVACSGKSTARAHGFLRWFGDQAISISYSSRRDLEKAVVIVASYVILKHDQRLKQRVQGNLSTDHVRVTFHVAHAHFRSFCALRSTMVAPLHRHERATVGVPAIRSKSIQSRLARVKWS